MFASMSARPILPPALLASALLASALLSPALLASALLLLSVDLQSQGKKPIAEKTFTCPMHPQIFLPAKGDCPICGMNLIPGHPVIKKVKITPGGLRAWCKTYLAKAIEVRPGNPHLLLPAIVALEGKGAAKKIRALLASKDEMWLKAAAYQLGMMQDLESVPLLEKMLADPKYAVSVSYYCPDHPGMTFAAPGKCKKCDRPLSTSFGKFDEHLIMAGALHRMGRESGQRALEKLAGQWYGGRALRHLGLHDSPKVREILDKATLIEDGLDGKDLARARYQRIQAICAQIQLGIDDHFAEAVQGLGTPKGWTQYGIFESFGKSGLEVAKKPLLEVMRDRNLSWDHRIYAATSLIQLGEKSFQGFLVGAYEQTAGTVDQIGVFLAWAEVGDKRALPLLETAIESGEHRFFATMAAARILGRLPKESKKD